MKSKHATDDFPWTANEEEDDLMCTLGDYTLRVEQMDRFVWWWYVGYNKMKIKSGLEKTLDIALGKSEGAYLGHKSVNGN